MKGIMKRVMLALAVIGLLAGCASHENATGGTSDQYNSSTSTSQDDSNINNPTKGTGTPMTTNSVNNNTSP